MAPSDPATVAALMAASAIAGKYAGKYAAIIDRESAYERLAAKLALPPQVTDQPDALPPEDAALGPRGRAKASGVEVLGKAVATAVATTAAREIMRGLFGNRRR